MSPTFADLGVPAPLCNELARRGITEAFPIQAATLPDALAGRDICGRAPTGSGKTIAFGLAIAARVGKAKPRHPRALLLVPTRELATQVAGEITSLLPRGSGKDVVSIFGGTGYGAQRKALSRGAAVVVACPGRLEDLLEQGALQLDEVNMVVLDEADRMADMGFLPAVRRILDLTSSKRQTMLFSATLDGDIDVVVRRYQNNPARHDVTPPDDTRDIEHNFWRAERNQHIPLTAALVQEHGRALVFCRTRRGADRVAKQLKAYGLRAASIHGSRTQAQRERALEAFSNGRAEALVATDVAARGIHVDDVPCVVHFDLPADPKDYLHRSGRTGRAGASGLVVALVTGEQRRAARSLQRAVGVADHLDSPTLAGAVIVPGRAVPDEPEPRGARPGSKPRSYGSKPKPRSGGKPSSPAKGRRPSRNGSSGNGYGGGSGRNGSGGHSGANRNTRRPGRGAGTGGRSRAAS